MINQSNRTEDPNDYNHIWQWLKPLLEERGWTIEQFANLTGTLSRISIYYYIHDKCRPTVNNMKSMCETLGVPVEEGLRQYTPKKRRKRGSKELRAE